MFPGLFWRAGELPAGAAFLGIRRTLELEVAVHTQATRDGRAAADWAMAAGLSDLLAQDEMRISGGWFGGVAFLFRFEFGDEVLDEAGAAGRDVHEFDADAADFVVGADASGNAEAGVVDGHEDFDLGAALQAEDNLGDQAAASGAEVLEFASEGKRAAEDDHFGRAFAAETAGLAALGSGGGRYGKRFGLDRHVSNSSGDGRAALRGSSGETALMLVISTVKRRT